MSEEKIANVGEMEDEVVSGAVRSLPKVDAPLGFEAGVKARIAASGSRKPWFLNPLISVPTLAAIAVGVVFLTRGGSVPQEVAQSVPPVIESAQVDVRPEKVQPAISEVKPADVAPEANRDPGGYVVIEKGAESAQVGEGPAAPPAGMAPKTASPRRASIYFASIGAPVSVDGEALKIVSVVSGSRAERSGLKAGDVLETMDGITLTGDIVLPHNGEFRIVIVRRSGERLPFGLNPR